MMNMKLTGLNTAILLAAQALGHGQIPAFPGAEGFGAYATGGRGGDVYYVNNLNTSGAGSFADAIATVPSNGRTIVFSVSGYIHVNKTALSKSKVTIAGQTAPGDGIGFKDGSFIINGSDIIIRHARFRYGDQAAGGDCINLDEGITDVILDHVSLAFSTDENISSFSQNPRPDLFTFQWSLNAWGLESHSCGGLWDLNRVTTHHTLWAHNHTRNPKARPDGLLDWINNVTFDWDIGFIMGDSTTPATWKANVQGDYFICPPGNLRSVALEKASIDRNGNYNFTLHVDNNLFDKNGDSLLNGSDYGYGIASGSYQISNAPIVVAGAQVPVAMDSPLTAYKKIVSRAGPLRLDALASIPLRDEVDTILINNLVTLKRNHVSHESQTGASNNGMGYLNSTPAPTDSDLDGMPDLWEQTLGWNPGVQDHNSVLANAGGFITGLTFFPPNTPAGYTRLEEYLHFLTIPHVTIPKNTPEGPSSFSCDLRKFATGFNKAPVVFTTLNTNNCTAVIQPDGYTVVVTPTQDFFGRARFDFNVTDGDGSSWTQTMAVLVSSVGVPRNLKWKGDGTLNQWNTNALNFLQGTNVTAYQYGDNVLFDDSGSASPAVQLGMTLSPSSIEVNATQDYTFAGPGSVNGSGPLTKAGSGTLSISMTNSSYSGHIDLAGGTLSLLDGTSLGTGTLTIRGNSTCNLVTGGHTDPLNPLIVPEGESAILTSGSLGNEFAGAVTGGSSSLITIGGSVSFKQGPEQFDGYPGTVSVPAGQTLRLSNTSGSNGGEDTTFNVDGTLMMRNEGTTGLLGALTGAGVLTGEKPAAGTLTFSVGAKNLDTTFAGTILDKNGPNTNTALIKVGSGTLELTGANPHSGTTTVSEGTLLVNGTNTSSPTVVSGGATLAGNGRIGGLITVNSGGRLAPGREAPGTLIAAGDVTLNTPTMLFELSGDPAENNDRIFMAGGLLTMTGTQNYQFSLIDGYLSEGTYTLIDGGANTDAAGVPLAHNLPTDTRQTFVMQRPPSANGQCYVRLVVTGDPTTLVWRGLASAYWDKTTTNWLDDAAPDRFYNLDTVVFDDTGASVPTVSLTTDVNPASILVTASTTRTFTGTGRLVGSGALTKSGSGTLMIMNSHNDFSGPVLLTGGTLNLAVAGATIGTGPMTLGGGATWDMPPTSIKYTYSGDITVLPGQSGTIYSPGLYSEIFSSFISGDTNSVLNISGGVSIGGTTASQFDAYHGVIHIQPGATLRFSAASSGNTFGSLNPTFIIDGTLRPRNAGNTVQLGALSGTGSIAGPQSDAGSGDTTYIIGGNDTDVVFDGVISSETAVSGSLVVLRKVGTGRLTLNGSSTYTGGTTVEAGSLIVNNSTGSGTGTGTLSVLGGATLGGSGHIGSLTTLADYAVLFPGNSIGTLTFDNDLTLGEFSELSFELGTASDAVVANAALTVAGTLNVIPAVGFGPGTYTLFTYNPANTFNYSGVVLGTVPEGFDYTIDTDTPGQVNLVVTPPTLPSFSGISVTGGMVIFQGTGGTPDTDYYVLSSTNLTTPLANWMHLATNQFDGDGNFAWTNISPPGTPQRFFRLRVEP